MKTPNYILEARGKADELRFQFDLGFDAINNIFHFIEEFGILLARRPMGENGVDGIYAKRKGNLLIVVNSDKIITRQRFTAAHELGHHLLDDTEGAVILVDKDVYDIGKSQSVVERRANAFAAHFLMPEAGIRRLLKLKRNSSEVSPYDVVHTQYHFGVSYQAALRQLFELGIISASIKAKWWALQPTKLAFEMGLGDICEGIEQQTNKKLPTDFIALAVKAYVEKDISLNRLAELLEEDSLLLKEKLLELGIKRKEPDIIEEIDEI